MKSKYFSGQMVISKILLETQVSIASCNTNSITMWHDGRLIIYSIDYYFSLEKNNTLQFNYTQLD